MCDDEAVKGTSELGTTSNDILLYDNLGDSDFRKCGTYSHSGNDNSTRRAARLKNMAFGEPKVHPWCASSRDTILLFRNLQSDQTLGIPHPLLPYSVSRPSLKLLLVRGVARFIVILYALTG